MFPYRPLSDVNDFYDSIQDNYEPNEGFGRYVSSNGQFNSFHKTNSYKDLRGLSAYEDGGNNCFSSQSFQENEELQSYYGKPTFVYSLEDHSTMASFSSAASISSQHNSFKSTNALNTPYNKSRSKISVIKKKNSGEVDYRKKYKTEVCKFWAEKGFCEFGDQCAFAHGTQEIRQKQHISSNYKTKQCIQFHEAGFCPYGVRCQFIHSLTKEVQKSRCLENPTYCDVMENPEIWVTHDPDCVCMQTKTRRRLPSFKLAETSVSKDDGCSRVNFDNGSMA